MAIQPATSQIWPTNAGPMAASRWVWCGPAGGPGPLRCARHRAGRRLRVQRWLRGDEKVSDYSGGPAFAGMTHYTENAHDDSHRRTFVRNGDDPLEALVHATSAVPAFLVK